MATLNTLNVQVRLIEHNTEQEVACVEGPGLFRTKTAEEYKITVSGCPADLQDDLWIRLVIVTGLLAAKQQRKRVGSMSSKRAVKGYNHDATSLEQRSFSSPALLRS